MSINWLSFNNNIVALTCGTDQGFIIYTLDGGFEKFKTYNIEDPIGSGVGIIRIHGISNMMLLVGGGDKPFKSKNIFILWDSIKNEAMIDLDMREPIKNVIINKAHMIAVLEKKICIFDWRGKFIEMKLTFSNEKGLCVMNINSDVIATLGTNKGEIAVWKYTTDVYKIIKAHNGHIEAVCLNTDGTFVATASDTGTLIRVFNVETEMLAYEFRRGTNSVEIYDISFSNNMEYLACCSANGTVHIWDLNSDENTTKNTQSRFSGFKSYLPQYFSSQWGMKQISLGTTARSICSFDKNNDLHIATYDGLYFKILGRMGEFINVSKGNLHINLK